MKKLIIVVFFMLMIVSSAQGANPVNGGFEDNLNGWDNLSGASISGDAHSGLKACQLASSGSANSTPFAVTGDEAYELTSYIKQIAGTGAYKVTLAWRATGGAVIRYDNDWAGHNQPAVYTLHGGVFTAPTNAIDCVIMIGVTSGTTCLFDDIELAATEHPPPDESFLDNGLIRVGVSQKWGGSIDSLAESSNPSRNYVNRHDAGRLIQRSYFGPPYSSDGPFPNWPWNPVQGGDGYENTSGVIELTNDGNTIYTKCQPMDWSGNNRRTNAIFETWISLEGRAVRIESCFTNADEDHALWRDQELLAVYVTTDLSMLKYYGGTTPFTNGSITTRLPGSTNEYYGATEYWAAFVNGSDFGVGAFSQDAMYHTTFRVGTQGVTDDYANPTNYFAIIPRFSVPNNAVRREVSYVMLDTVPNMRDFVYSKAKRISNVHWKFEEDNNREGWSGGNAIDDTTLGVSGGKWSFTTSSSDPYVIGPHFEIPAHIFDSITIRMSSTNSSTLGEIFWSRLTDGILSFPSSCSKTFTVIPDGQMHAYAIDLSGHSYWSGTINKLRLDPVSTGSGGMVSIDYIKIDSNIFGDLDNSGFISWGDLRVICQNWLKVDEAIEGDLNNDEMVNFLDFSLLALHWLEGTE